MLAQLSPNLFYFIFLRGFQLGYYPLGFGTFLSLFLVAEDAVYNDNIFPDWCLAGELEFLVLVIVLAEWSGVWCSN